jgi:hypothetical protein
MYVRVKISRMKLQRNQSLKKTLSNYKSWNHDDQSHELSRLDEKTQKKKDQTQKCNICHIFHLTYVNKLGTDYVFNTKFEIDLGLTTRLMVIGQFWRLLNTLLEVMFMFKQLLEIDCSR